MSINKITLAAVGLLGIYWMRNMDLVSTIRGIRNNNPGNIRWDGKTQWEGMAGQDKDGFVVFESVEYGIRAMERILRSYGRQGINSIAGIVSRWAPPEDDNDTASYINSVAAHTGIGAYDPVLPADHPHIIAALIRHENGINPYSQALIQRGVSMA